MLYVLGGPQRELDESHFEYYFHKAEVNTVFLSIFKSAFQIDFEISISFALIMQGPVGHNGERLANSKVEMGISY